MAAQILFFLLATVAIAAGLGMLLSKSPVSSALWLILNLFCIAGLYLTLNAEFIAVVQILVYAGAIMVLFLFVIMLLNLDALPDVNNIEWKRVFGFTLGMGVLALLWFAVASSLDILPYKISAGRAAEVGSATSLGEVLFTQYAMPLEVIGILLLAATIGAVMIAKRKPV
ncbi:MAG: NADH-quinone oxidoreductase subunit J [Rhodothermia bacterium]|nr:MAG: NADH-quinone oxidoreductase subunit J [Rhodothermia bacterium]